MNNNHSSTLNNRYDGQRIFNARKDGYSFDVFSDTWELDYKNYLYLDWMNELDINVETYLDLRLAIAHAAKHCAYSSLNTYVSAVKSIVAYLNIYDFQAWWLTLDNYKKTAKKCLTALCHPRNGYASTILQPLYDAIKNENLGTQNMIKGILDPKTGAYSEVEHDNILESLRIETLRVFEGEILSQKTFTALRNIIGSQLLAALIRRPTQLVQIKWCDICNRSPAPA